MSTPDSATIPTAPLAGVRILELAGIGPGPFAGMMLADMGAEVIRIDRPGGNPFAIAPPHDVLYRSRRSIAIDLKDPKGIETVLRLCEGADALFEGYRPGVAERLGVGPEDCQARNPALVYGRMTGWGQDGPLAPRAGHDINYIALTGALHAIGRRGEAPMPPLNLVGDFGGGGMLLAYGLVCGIVQARVSGRGQVVDAAMVDGASALMAMFHGLNNAGLHNPERGTNMLDTGAHFYDVFRTKDDRWVSLGPVEPQFYALMCDVLELDDDLRGSQFDQARWPELKQKLAAVVVERTRDELDALFEGSDACYAPVLELSEAPQHPHNVARGAFVDVAGQTHPAPAPRFDGAPPTRPHAAAIPGTDTRATLLDAGFDAAEIDELIAAGAVAEA
ncbi:Alpha-methylacyl-CoA racemase [Patulibacter medicamentivorans]|uniref:Alpha-methylacyl-CoA racemase n=1 Tax=Patulibacter medicamentivorans TaxID=1097667 RepID=H0E9M4_9ACTN|nr:CoA transferase [Patulibacter medicamentivorans]EHN09624.1 Alpha-methylacyl-CoA racemase [Patulibacter medicamentivorans]